MENYAGEIQYAETKAKDHKRFEDCIGVAIGRFTPDTDQKGFTKRLRTCVGHTGGGQVEHML